MKNNLYLRYFTGLIMLTIFSTIILNLFALPSEGVPAYPGVQTHVQKDGTLVFIQLHGDEFFNYISDSDGNLVTYGEDGDICIAQWAKESDFWENERPALYVATNEKPTGARPGTNPPKEDDMPALKLPIPKYISEYASKRRIWFMNQSLPAINTISLPKGVKGTYYSKTLRTFETIAPISWTIDSGSLPDGLSMNDVGNISGTPELADTFNFTVKATNTEGFDTQNLSIIVTPYDEEDEQGEEDEQKEKDDLKKKDGQDEKDIQQADGSGGCNVTPGVVLIMLSTLLLLL